MSSINTNGAAMTALQSLQQTNSMLDQTQNRISTGLKVASAKDNAAYWSIATTMRSETSSLGAVSEALGIGASQADVASTGIESLIKLGSQIRDRVASVGQEGVDAEKVQTELNQLFKQMETVINSSEVNGQNWLETSTDENDALTNTNASVLAGLTKETDEDGVITTSLQKITVDLTASLGENKAFAQGFVDHISGIKVNEAAFNAGTELGKIDNAIKGLTELGANFGAASSRIDIQKEFTSNLVDALDRGIGALVDADMTEESTKLKALQTQQQLGVQALSIANNSSQSLLQLFR